MDRIQSVHNRRFPPLSGLSEVVIEGILGTIGEYNHRYGFRILVRCITDLHHFD